MFLLCVLNITTDSYDSSHFNYHKSDHTEILRGKNRILVAVKK